ncbi:MAG: HEAT repeat domain-containing protein [Tepidisphaeraceae bacterium]
MTVGRPVVLLTTMLAAGASAGCSGAPGPRTVINPDPSVKIPAIKQAVREKDRDAVRQLVKDLESDDPAVRFYAIEGLQRLTRQDFGYVFYQGEDARKPALKRWRQWVNGEPVTYPEPTTASTAPASDGATAGSE